MDCGGSRGSGRTAQKPVPWGRTGPVRPAPSGGRVSGGKTGVALCYDAPVKRVLITGGSGFIGKRLVRELLDRGDLVTVLSRTPEKTRRELPVAVRVAGWTPGKKGPWCDEVDGVDAVVHLAGELVAQRWSDKKRAEIEKSRIGSTEVLVEAMGAARHKPGVLVCASATGYYGPRGGDELLDEESAPGNDFLAGLVQRWEAAAEGASAHGIRAVELRIGVVFGPGGGALEQLARPFKLFAGGPIGDGKQVMSWVHRDDVVGMILFAIDHAEAKGAMNAVSPYAATNREVADALGVVLGRPSFLPTPAAVIGLVLGEAASIVTTGQRVVPKKAAELGYEFRHARLVPALESILGE